MFFGGGYKASKLKPQLKMAVTRFGISGNKKSALMKQQIREIAALLADDPPKEEKARIKAEALIRDDNTVEAYEILQLNCDLLSERIHLISHSRECPPDMVSCVSTLIWASAIVDIPELVEIRKQFRHKYGKEFDAAAMQNLGGVINDRVAARLSVQPPSAYLVQTYLEKIADEHEVDWKPKVPLKAGEAGEAMPAPGGYSVPVGGGSGLNPHRHDEDVQVYNSEHDPNNDGQASAPLASPSFMGIPPEAPHGIRGGGGGGGDASTVSTMSSTNQQSKYVPQPEPAKYVPVLPTPGAPPASPNVPASIDDVAVEEDIFVPGGTTRTPTGGGGKTYNGDGHDHNHGGGGGQCAECGGTGKRGSGGSGSGGGPSAPANDGGGGGGGEESYDDLAARFAMLNK